MFYCDNPVYTTQKWPCRNPEEILCIYGNWNPNTRTLAKAFEDPGVQIITLLRTGARDYSDTYGLRSILFDPTWTLFDMCEVVKGASNLPFLGAISFTEDNSIIAEVINQELLQSSRSHHLVRNKIRNKAVLYNLMKQKRIPTPLFHILHDLDELHNLVKRGLYQQGKYIVKPACASDSAGVYRSYASEDIEETLRNARRLSQEATRLLSIPDEQEWIVMEYIDWDGEPVEVSIEGIVDNSGELNVSLIHEKLQVRSVAPFIDSLMVSPPISPKVALHSSEIQQRAQAIVSAANIRSTTIHFEFRLTAEDVFAIDCAMRPGGGCIAHAFYQHTFIDLRLAHINLSLGYSVQLPSRRATSIGTCIGAMYINRPELYKETLLKWEELLVNDPVFALSANKKWVNTPLFTADAAFSLGVRGMSASTALATFNAIKYSIGMEGENGSEQKK